jgi:histidinol phosphatase-like enzyme
VWTRRLKFYKDEIDMFESYLGEVAVKNTSKDCLASVEHFQNQFIRQKEVIDEFVHDIKIKEESLARYAEENPVAIDRKYFEPEPAMTDRYQTFEHIYQDLKEEYRRFLAKWM